MAYNFFDFETKKELTAVYRGRYASVGAFQKPVHCFVDEDGSTVHVWGCAVLNHLLYGIPFGTKLWVHYLGKFKSDSSQYPMLQYEIKVLELAPDGRTIPKKEKG